MTKREKALWVEMAELTAPLCAGKAPGGCKVPHSCCNSMYCDMAFEIARYLGETLEPANHDPHLPLMGPNGCTAAPHLRPLCSVHVCCINNLGFNPDDPAWTEKYFQLRRKLEKTLVELV